MQAIADICQWSPVVGPATILILLNADAGVNRY